MEAALLLVKGLTICPDTSSLPGGATAGKPLALRQAPSSPGRVAVCLLTGSGKNSRGSQQETRGHIPLGPAGQHGQHTFIPRVTDS